MWMLKWRSGSSESPCGTALLKSAAAAGEIRSSPNHCQVCGAAAVASLSAPPGMALNMTPL